MAATSLTLVHRPDEGPTTSVRIDNIPFSTPVSSILQKLSGNRIVRVRPWGELALISEGRVLDRSESVSDYESLDVSCVLSLSNFFRNFVFLLVFAASLIFVTTTCIRAYRVHRIILGFVAFFLGGLCIGLASLLCRPAVDPWLIFDFRSQAQAPTNNVALEVLRLFFVSFSPTFRLGDAGRPDEAQ
jgi:hypothetical protein